MKDVDKSVVVLAGENEEKEWKRALLFLSEKMKKKSGREKCKKEE